MSIKCNCVKLVYEVRKEFLGSPSKLMFGFPRHSEVFSLDVQGTGREPKMGKGIRGDLFANKTCCKYVLSQANFWPQVYNYLLLSLAQI